PILSLFPYLSFFLTAPPPTHIYTLSLHDALPISPNPDPDLPFAPRRPIPALDGFIGWFRSAGHSNYNSLQLRAEKRFSHGLTFLDRKSTRLNSSHGSISYAVFCLKKKKQKTTIIL